MSNETSLSFFQEFQLSCMRLLGKGIRKLGIKRGYKIASFFADILWYCNKGRRNLATHNIMRCLKVSEERAREIAKASFRHNFCSFTELVFTQVLIFHTFGDNLHVLDKDMLDDFFHTNRPLVGVTGHFGSWEILASMMNGLRPNERPQVVVTRKYNNPATQKYIVEQRSITGTTILGHRDVVMPALRALRKNGGVAFLVDHRPTKESEATYVPFFGMKTAVNMGPALLAVRSKALVWPMFLNREKDNSYTCHVYKPLDTVLLEGTQEEKILATATYYTNIMEEHITKYPEQWFWMHNRWKPYKH